MVISASLWSIWVARDDQIFNKIKIKEKKIQELIFIRVAKWGSASNIMSFGQGPLWRVNPIGALNVHHRKDMNLFSAGK